MARAEDIKIGFQYGLVGIDEDEGELHGDFGYDDAEYELLRAMELTGMHVLVVSEETDGYFNIKIGCCTIDGLSAKYLVA